MSCSEFKPRQLTDQQQRRNLPSALAESGTLTRCHCDEAAGQVKVVRLGQDSKIKDFILKATFSKHICHCARTKAYRRSSSQASLAAPTRSGATTAGSRDNFVFLIVFFCLISKHDNTLQDSFSRLFRLFFFRSVVGCIFYFYFYFLLLLCFGFFFSLTPLFT